MYESRTKMKWDDKNTERNEEQSLKLAARGGHKHQVPMPSFFYALAYVLCNVM